MAFPPYSLVTIHVPHHFRRAFSLVEIMVVVVILLILVAVTLPILANAREQAKTTLCASNLRQMAQMMTEFANTHDGRGPGEDCVCNNPATSPLHPGWSDLLNDEVLNRGHIEFNDASAEKPAAAYGIVDGHGKVSPPSLRALSCPNFIVLPLANPNDNGPWNYAFALNEDVCGGSTTGNVPQCGIFGTYVNPTNRTFTDDNYMEQTYKTYSLGPKLMRFRSDQFLIIEGEEAPTTPDALSGSANYATINGKVNIPTNKVASDPPMPAYSGRSVSVYGSSNVGSASFRHPYFRMGNFLCMDSHVETLTPKDNILSPHRLALQ